MNDQLLYSIENVDDGFAVYIGDTHAPDGQDCVQVGTCTIGMFCEVVKRAISEGADVFARWNDSLTDPPREWEEQAVREWLGEQLWGTDEEHRQVVDVYVDDWVLERYRREGDQHELAK